MSQVQVPSLSASCGEQNRVRAAGKAPYHPGMDLREELPGDRESVRAIHRRAFGDHGLVVADLVDTLRETITLTDGLTLVAEHDGHIAGHVMFTRSLLDAPRRLVEVQVLSPLATRASVSHPCAFRTAPFRPSSSRTMSRG
jgi:putative acetyltransferase